MLDPKLIRESPDLVKAGLKKRGAETSLQPFLEADARRRALLTESETLKHERNQVSDEIAKAKQAGQDASARIEQMREVSQRIKVLDDQVREVEAKIEELLLALPNLPDESVPDGLTEDENEIVRTWGQPRKFDFQPKPHWEIGPALGILDFERAAKIAGARFEVLRGAGAQLRRALIDLMIDVHTKEHGYTEIFPPILASRDTLTASGHLPMFEEDQFHVKERDLLLIPTAESPLANLHRDEILEGNQLPLYYVAYTPCFRYEKVGAGKESRGLIRQYQFDKVELFKYTSPETSMEELKTLVQNAEAIYQRLNLPYKLELHCAGDMSPAAVKAYDPLAWFPGTEKWLELSSCSLCTDWQARRANIRYRPQPGAKPAFVHTLNGSGLAVGRTLAAVLENYQQEDGSVRIPEALVPYMDGLEVIS